MRPFHLLSACRGVKLPDQPGLSRRLSWLSRPPVCRALLACFWLGAGIIALRSVPHASGAALVRMPPLFWLTVCAYVAIHPIADLAIFRSVWGRQSGMLPAVIRRFVGNELLFGYAGEAYLFAWARSRKIPHALHGVKDVAILSAFVGHAIAIFLFLPLIAYRGASGLGLTAGQLGASVFCIAAFSVTMVLLRDRLLKLSSHQSAFITAVHLLRALAMAALFIPLWIFAAPALGLGTCVVLVAIRQLVSRLPLVPGKDLIFAAIIVASQGTGQGAAEGVSVTAIAVICVEALVAIALAIMTVAARSVKAEAMRETMTGTRGASVVIGRAEQPGSAGEVVAALPEILQRTIVGIGFEPPTLAHGRREIRLMPHFDQMVASGLLVRAASGGGTTYHLTRLGRAVRDIILREHDGARESVVRARSSNETCDVPHGQDQAVPTARPMRVVATASSRPRCEI
ncbi:hypothetical protein [Sphingomonas sp. PL20]|uniref:hypothetical protein n=1 Tax=Sphingomonas sp. PL20 TaxID=2760712 RepID=UPI001AE84B8D